MEMSTQQYIASGTCSHHSAPLPPSNFFFKGACINFRRSFKKIPSCWLAFFRGGMGKQWEEPLRSSPFWGGGLNLGMRTTTRTPAKMPTSMWNRTSTHPTHDQMTKRAINELHPFLERTLDLGIIVWQLVNPLQDISPLLLWENRTCTSFLPSWRGTTNSFARVKAWTVAARGAR